MENQGERRRVEELDALIHAHDEERSRLRAEREGIKAELEEKITELTGFLSERDGEIRGLKLQNLVAGEEHARIAELEAILEQRDHRIGELEHFLRERDSELERRNQLAGDDRDREMLFSRMQDLEWFLGERDEDLRCMTAERDHLAWKLRESGQADSRIEELTNLLNERDDQIDGIRFEKEGLAFQLRERNHEIDSLRNALNSRHQHLESRISELEWLLGERDGELHHLRSEREGLVHHLSARERELSGRIGELEWYLGERDADLDRLRNERGDLRNLLESRDVEMEAIRREPESGSRIQELEWLLGERDGELHHLKCAGDEKLESLRAERSAKEEQEARVRELEWILGERDRELMLLREEFTHREPAEEAGLAARVFDAENIVFDERLGNLYPEPPEQIDDLKRIHGIAKVLEKKLHDLGVFRYKQIAVWDPRHLKEFRRLLNVNGHADLENWIVEAGEKHLEKYGERIPGS